MFPTRTARVSRGRQSGSIAKPAIADIAPSSVSRKVALLSTRSTISARSHVLGVSLTHAGTLVAEYARPSCSIT